MNLTNWLSKSVRKSIRKSQTDKNRTRLEMETLEDRLVPATMRLWGTSLNFFGHDYAHNDVRITSRTDGGINVRMLSSYYNNGWSSGSYYLVDSFSAGQVQSIAFYGNKFNDYFENNSNIRSNAYGRAGNDTLIGGNGVDYLYGEGGADSLKGNGGGDRMYGGAGNDTLRGGYGRDTLYGGAGIDRLYGESNDDVLYGHNGSAYSDANETDYLYGSWGNDSLFGEGGNDRLYGYSGNDVLRGGDGNDSLWGDSGNDSLYGESGNDYLDGGWHNDMLFGGVLDNRMTLIGSYDPYVDGRDRLYGNSGADRLLVDTTDEVRYPNSQDATIVFKHGQARTISGTSYPASQWTNRDVERVDWAFGVLHNATGNTKLLKRSNGNSMEFHRHGGTGRGWNFGGGEIILTNAQLNSGGETWLRGYVLHEVGHNWNGNQIGSTRWSNFQNLSSWRLSGGSWTFDATANFASNYATNSPNEDWGESFAAYFLQLGGESWYAPWDGSGASAIPDKIALIDAWVDTL